MNDATTTIFAEPLALDDALTRFSREASREVFDTGRYRCRYYVWGEGPPLLLVHGMGETSRAFVPLVSLLSEHFKCIAYDLPSGHHDGANLARYRHSELVLDALGLLEHLGIARSYLFGTSFGSTIVLAAMHAAAARFGRAIVTGGFANRHLSKPEKILAGVSRALPGAARWMPFRKLVGRHNFGPQAKRRPDYLGYFTKVSGQPRISAMARRALMIDRTDLRPLLPQIQQPVLVLSGDYDHLVSRKCADALLAGIPHATHVELPDCGHFAHYSHPEALAEIVHRFLTPPACPLGHE
jgi:3-oxoadipate enol-lactonase